MDILGQSIFGLMEYTAANVLLPLGALLIVIFVGWNLQKKRVYKEVSNENVLKVRYFKIFFFIVKWLAPLAIAAIFLNGVGLLKLG